MINDLNTISRREVLRCIDTYLRFNPSERDLLRLRSYVERGADFTSRKSFEGHVTCGALVLNSEERVLQIYHRALDKWLLPGGHIEATDKSLIDAAFRELEEEVGINRARLECISFGASPIPVDINFHQIPKNEKKSEPNHPHWDFRYMFRTNSAVVHMQLDEIADAQWRDVSDLDADLRRKVQALINSPAAKRRRVA